MSSSGQAECSPPNESAHTADLRELAANGSAPHTQKGEAQFTTTHWSVVLEAQSESPVAQEALEKLCRAYWRPIYGFVQRQGIGSEEAKDITQGFFADLLEHKSLAAVRKEKGRFRSYLLGALKHFLADERRRAMAIKRGKGQLLIPLEELSPDERTEIELTDPLTAEQIFERRWASTVLARVLGLLKNEYVAAGIGPEPGPKAQIRGPITNELRQTSRLLDPGHRPEKLRRLREMRSHANCAGYRRRAREVQNV